MIAEKYIVSETSTITGIPLIVRIDIVHVDFELAIVIAIGVEAVQNCKNNHLFHCQSKHFSIRDRAVYYFEHQSSPITFTNILFFNLENIIALLYKS